LAACRAKEGPAARPSSADTSDAFAAKVAEVESYMKGHDIKNTPAAELAAALTRFEGDFRRLEREAGADAALAARCRLAADSMALYVQSVNTPAGDARALELALAAQGKWERAKGEGPAGR